MQKRIAVILGSESDLSSLEEGFKILDEFKIGYSVDIISAHRCPEEVALFARGAAAKGVKVIIAAAGAAAALPGVVAAHTTLPVIGVPMEGKALSGMDALLSIVQMPGGVPVGCMAIGRAGAKNAAIFAAEILALSDKKIAAGLADFKQQLKQSRKKIK